MEGFFKLTAWQIETPKSYGSFHIITTIILFAIALALTLLLRKANEKQNRIILLVVGLFLMITEVYKQLFYVYIRPEYNLAWIFPFQLCSVPMYMCVICFFIKSKKINDWLYNFMGMVNFLGGIMAFIEPSGIHHGYLTLTLHAYIWHMTLVFLGMYLFASGRTVIKPNGYFKGYAVFLCCCVIAQILNVIGKDIDGFNMFYISPFSRSPLVVFKDFYVSIGWFWTMILYLFAIAIASAIIYYGLYGIKLLYNRKKLK